MRFRSPRALGWALRFWLLVGVIAGFGLNTWGTALNDDRLWLPGLLAGAGLAVAGCAWSLIRMALVVDDRGVEVRNAVRTWRATWPEIAEIRMHHVGLPLGVARHMPGFFQGHRPPAVGFRLRDGRHLPAAQATAYLTAERREAAVTELGAQAEAHGITMTLRAQELV